MSEKRLESEYIPIVFVEMSGEGMAKTMAGKTVRPAKLLLRQTDMTADILGAGSSGGIPAGREEISHGPAVNAPVMSERVQRKGRERDIAVRTVLGSGDMDLHVCPADILIAKAKDFTDTKTAAVHQNDHDLRFQIIDRIDEITDDTFQLAGGAGSRRGTGGMRTKLEAARLATAQGISTIVTNGAHPDALYSVVAGRKVGTLFKGNRR